MGVSKQNPTVFLKLTAVLTMLTLMLIPHQKQGLYAERLESDQGAYWCPITATAIGSFCGVAGLHWGFACGLTVGTTCVAVREWLRRAPNDETRKILLEAEELERLNLLLGITTHTDQCREVDQIQCIERR